MIHAVVSRYFPEEEVLFVVSNFLDDARNSSDVDIYCVTRRRSAVHCFYNEQGQWIELFADSLADLRRKIENVDEIAINFLHELRFIEGDKKLYALLLSKTAPIMADYRLPTYRKNILRYRVKVLLSKFINPERNANKAQLHFILNAISYPLVQLILEQHHIFPSSPKRWLMQLEKKLPPQEFDKIAKFLSHACDQKAVVELCEEYAGKLDAIHIPEKKNNEITFLS